MAGKVDGRSERMKLFGARTKEFWAHKRAHPDDKVTLKEWIALHPLPELGEVPKPPKEISTLEKQPSATTMKEQQPVVPVKVEQKAETIKKKFINGGPYEDPEDNKWV